MQPEQVFLKLEHEFLTLEEVADYTHLPVEVVWALCEVGLGPDRAVEFYRADEVQDWVWDNFRDVKRFFGPDNCTESNAYLYKTGPV